MLRRSARARRSAIRLPACVAAAASALLALPALASNELADLSLEELMNIEVTSVSKRAQSKADTATAITVITAEDIRRSGMTSVPDLLRLVPGVQVAQITANRWAIGVRGFNEEFSNKMLVLIDGRSVYTPYFGGTYWDIQDYPFDDIERIEVIRGPGGTIWGENAVNGVVNIITKSARETRGALIAAQGGTQGYRGTTRYGGTVGDKLDYRVFAHGFDTFDYDTTRRYSAHDEWAQFRVGTRLDAQPTNADAARLSFEYYQQDADSTFPSTSNPGSFDTAYNEANGGHVLGTWTHTFDANSSLRTQAYYDRTNRDSSNASGEDRSIADFEFQHDLQMPDAQLDLGSDLRLLESADLSWGGSFRYSENHLSPANRAAVVPNHDQFKNGNAFLQLTGHSWEKRVAVSLGTKLGVNNWSGFEYQPSFRVLVKPEEGHSVWGAISRAVRLPTQVDRDVRIGIGPLLLLGSNDTRGEDLTAFEVGYRFTPFERLTAELSLYYNLYENARAFVFVGPGVIRFDNQGRAAARGLELETKIRLTDWWTATIGYAYFDVDEDFPSTNVVFTPAKGANPDHQVVLQQRFDVSDDVSFDASLFYTDGLPGQIPAGRTDNVENYVRLDLRAAYRPFDWLELAVIGQNLTDPRHYEYADIQLAESSQVPRTVHGTVRVEF